MHLNKDVSIAALILLLTLPILATFSILIILEDGLPILYRSERIGKSGKSFTLYKFRSMKKQTPLVESQKLSNPESFLLRTGAIMRKLSIDEIPNLVNVLKGEMHIIGYRPAIKSQLFLNSQRELNGITEYSPGITGLAQVRKRDFITDREKICYEKFYIKKRNWKLNFKIILETFFSIKLVSH